LERGQGSFSAEQFLDLLKQFNVPASYFTSGKSEPGAGLQNALARLGASHLRESLEVLPSERLEETDQVVKEVLVGGESSRQITSLAPVLIKNLDHLNLNKLWVQFVEYGLERRLGWLLESTVLAVQVIKDQFRTLPRKQKAALQRTELIIAPF
jgi:hypothetical protein